MSTQRFTIEVTYDDDSVQRVTTNARDIMAVERVLHSGFVTLLESATMTAFVNVAYQALKRTGAIPGDKSFAVWVETVADVDPDAGEAETADPGQPEAINDSPSTSPVRRARASGKSASAGTTRT